MMKNTILTLCLLLFASINSNAYSLSNAVTDGDLPAQTAVIIQVGAGELRAGLSTGTAPDVVFSQTFAPYGIIENWSGFESALTQVFSRLGISSDQYPVMIVDTPVKLNRIKIVQLLFNTFNVPSLYIATDAMLALYATGRSTGIVVNFEAGATHATPVEWTYILPHAFFRMDIGGNDIANYMKSLLKNKGHTISLEDAEGILGTLGYTALDFGQEMQKSANTMAKTYTLAGGKNISIDKERFKAPEAILQPGFMGMQSSGIHEITYSSIMKCDVLVRKDLYANIILCGSNSLFPGIEDRIKKEIDAIASPGMNVVVTALPNREYLPWTGAKKMVPLLDPNNMWLSKAVFNTQGTSIVAHKFSY